MVMPICFSPGLLWFRESSGLHFTVGIGDGERIVFILCYDQTVVVKPPMTTDLRARVLTMYLFNRHSDFIHIIISLKTVYDAKMVVIFIRLTNGDFKC
ncbi:hypothetical protein WN943_002562 [Citrus x changshan-huyou]